MRKGAEWRANKLTASEYDETTWSARTWIEGVTGSSSQKKSGRPSQSCRVYFSVIEPRLRLFRFAVFTEVDLVPYAPPALANVEWFFQYIYRLEGLPEMLRTAFFCCGGGLECHQIG